MEDLTGMPSPLISVHFPKAAGSSLRHAYETALGAERILQDYNNDPVNPSALINIHPIRYEETKPTTLGEYTIVHGHFHAGRYNRINGAARVVALRDPVDNLISIYYYWDSLRQNKSTDGHSLFKYFSQSKLSLLEFATIPLIRDLMSWTYFRNIDMKCFDVIGDYSDLDRYLTRIGKLINVKFGAMPKLNVTTPSPERQATLEDSRLLGRLRDLVADDLRFYERYCNR
jgi:hypothetical protein